MKNNAPTKKFLLVGLLLVSGLTGPSFLHAQTAPTTTIPPECQNTTASSTIEQRKKCDAAMLKLDQENLKKIRDLEDGPEVQKNYDSCKSEYPANGIQPIGGSDQYVPVHETGDLLNFGKNTDINTGKAYDMQVLLCMYLHAIKRVNYAMEDLTFIKEPDMRRQAATQVEKYREGILGKGGMMKTGYQPAGKQAETAKGGDTGQTLNKASLYPENLSSYLLDANDEGYGVFMDSYNNYSSNSFKLDVSAQLAIDEELGGTLSLNSTVPKEVYDNFMSAESSDLPPADWWGTFNAIFDITRPNNPYSAYTQARNSLDAQKSRRESLALEEYRTGGGFLPIRTCITYTTDGKYCRVWKTITPGQAIAQTSGDALSARLNEYENPEIGQVGNGNEPTTNDVQTFTTSPGTGGGTTGGQSDSGTGGGNDDGGGNGGGGDNGGGDDPQLPAPYATIMANNLSNGNRVITWGSVNTTYCVAGNDWLGSTDSTSRLLTVIKSKSAVVQPTAEGSLTIYPPLKFTTSWTKNAGTYSGAQLTTSTTTNGASLKVTWSPSAPVNSTDSYTLKIQDGQKIEGFTITVGGTQNPFADKTAKNVVQAFYDFWKANKNIPVYQRYNFTYDLAGGKISINVIDPVYQLECKGENGSTYKASSDQ